MTIEETGKLAHGLYRVFWKESEGGGTSLASVGSMYSGRRWLAPCNWTSDDKKRIGPAAWSAKCWGRVDRVVALRFEFKRVET